MKDTYHFYVLEWLFGKAFEWDWDKFGAGMILEDIKSLLLERFVIGHDTFQRWLKSDICSSRDIDEINKAFIKVLNARSLEGLKRRLKSLDDLIGEYFSEEAYRDYYKSEYHEGTEEEDWGMKNAKFETVQAIMNLMAIPNPTTREQEIWDEVLFYIADIFFGIPVTPERLAREKFPAPSTSDQELWNTAIDYIAETIAMTEAGIGDDKNDGKRI